MVGFFFLRFENLNWYCGALLVHWSAELIISLTFSVLPKFSFWMTTSIPCNSLYNLSHDTRTKLLIIRLSIVQAIGTLHIDKPSSSTTPRSIALYKTFLICCGCTLEVGKINKFNKSSSAQFFIVGLCCNVELNL